jgi:hypothetical protein
MATEIQSSRIGKTRDEWRRACDTALHNAEKRVSSKSAPIYQRRTLAGAALPLLTSNEELNIAATALAALWGTTKTPQRK